ncbi:MAG: hypothetical protein H0W99_03995, partial [Acidobacteria bacterium]|nr:hypothetical protein [Acidobacteriota bacterium]
MRNHLTGLAANPLRLLTATFILLAAAASPVMAQRERNRALAERNRGNQAALNEWRRTHMAEEINKQFEKKRISLLPQIKEDFTRLQLVNNEMMRKIYDGEGLDYQRISDSIAEIRKRANRLKANPMLPDAANDEKSLQSLATPVTGQVKESLMVLDTLIMSFVRNPLFQQPGVVDAKLSSKGGRDLKAIIEFTGGIR